MLKRGAIVGGALAWSVPTIQVISMTAAKAEGPSGVPPNTPPGNTPPRNSIPTDPQSKQTSAGDPVAKTSETGAATDASGGGSLAYTGVSAVPMAITAGGLIAAGTAATIAGKKRVQVRDQSKDS